jgi:uncharacterized damage-inducible protein DinB
MIGEIHELFEFNRWANQRMLDAVAALSVEQFTRDLKSSFPSVRDTLVHLVGADWIWLSRWLGTSPASMPGDWDMSTLEAIRARWAQIEHERTALLERLTPEALHSMLAYRTIRGDPFANPLWQLLRHVVNHSTYHRGQITTMLRQLGMPAVSTDLVLFYRERVVPEAARPV